MSNNFILTYSVVAQSTLNSDKEKAQKVRDKIATLGDWNKLTDVDTVFTGNINAYGIDDTAKKKQAKLIVTNEILPILKEFTAPKTDVIVYCAMMLDNVKQPFEFDIKY
ncbi:hypothetical protein MFFDBJGM_02490 [Pectobacterium versatile]|uniref:hypothetical protein n=1 Tax=Pectobacterium versatile TaxID=2488639 RepID=UPI000DAB3649|nr:hypothetical protein [Pectobacterium versatile]GBO49472.1 hypothetical protein MFFDBJGM_02490 [Pectobacterium versatile]